MATTEHIRTLLDREPPPDYRQECTEHVGRAVETVAPQTESVVIFRIGGEWLALSTALYQGIADPSPTHTLPRRTGGAAIGLTSIQGELVVSVSLAALLGIDASATNGSSPNGTVDRVMLIAGNGGPIACRVAEVLGVQRYRPEELQDVPATLSHAATRYTAGLFSKDGRWVARLDDALVLRAINEALS